MVALGDVALSSTPLTCLEPLDVFLHRAQCTNAKGTLTCQLPLHTPCQALAAKGESIEEIRALWDTWAAWADGSGAKGLAFLAGRWWPAGSDELTQFVSHPGWFTTSHPHLPQYCWAILEGEKLKFFPLSNSPSPCSLGQYLHSRWEPHNLQWQHYRGWHSLHWFTAEDETVRKMGQVRA